MWNYLNEVHREKTVLTIFNSSVTNIILQVLIVQNSFIISKKCICGKIATVVATNRFQY